MTFLRRFGAAAVLGLAFTSSAAIPDEPSAASFTHELKQWQPPAGTTTTELWPAGLSIGRPEVTGPERSTVYNGPKAPLGKPTTTVFDVTKPTMTIYPARGHNTGAAVLVFPGGGYQVLAIDFEGTEVCDWLAPRGINCAVLKYRVPQTWWPKGGRGQVAPKVQMALQDAERAMSLLRSRAKDFGTDKRRIGVLGFSAGGHMVAEISNAEQRNYHPVDLADRESFRPNFAVALYPGHLWSGEGMNLYSFDPISPSAPPTFLLQAEDDPVDDVRNSIAYFLALRSVKVPVEMHIYAHGGHAFGLRRTAQPITHWPELVEKWLHTIGVL